MALSGKSEIPVDLFGKLDFDDSLLINGEGLVPLDSDETLVLREN